MGANTSQEIDNNQYPAKKMIRYPQITSNSRPSTQKPILKKSCQKSAELSPCDSAFRASRISSIAQSNRRSPTSISPEAYKIDNEKGTQTEELTRAQLCLENRNLESICFKESQKTRSKTNGTGYKMTLDDFEIIRCIGIGGFSTVIEVKKKDTGKTYAMKIIQKSMIEKKSKIKQIMAERNILKMVDNPFVIKLHWAFKSKDYLHMVLDYCPGGEFFFHLSK